MLVPAERSMSLAIVAICHIRPYLPENTGSRPLSHSQANEGRISSWVGDDQRIPAVVCLFEIFVYLYCLLFCGGVLLRLSRLWVGATVLLEAPVTVP